MGFVSTEHRSFNRILSRFQADNLYPVLLQVSLELTRLICAERSSFSFSLEVQSQSSILNTLNQQTMSYGGGYSQGGGRSYGGGYGGGRDHGGGGGGGGGYGSRDGGHNG